VLPVAIRLIKPVPNIYIFMLPPA